jgi:TatD DNase family protein
MIDTHCHLTDPRLLVQVDAVIARAVAGSVKRMVTIGTVPADWGKCLEVCRKYPNVRCAIGVHPNYCNEVELADVEPLRVMQGDPAVCAVGEMGMDYHYDSVGKDRQRKFFELQLQIASEAKRPVVIHSRKAIDDCLEIMKGYSIPAGVFHCFTGTRDEARRVFDAGWYMGFTGVVTFKNGEELRKIAAFAPADRIVVETDAPYLSPEPKRGQKVNEPLLVVHVAAAVASARGISLEEVDRITSENASRLYQWA